MSDYTISIPDSLYDKAQRLAEQTAQPIDVVIRTRLAGALDQPMLDLPIGEQAELRALSYLSDDTLWTIAQEQMQSNLQARLSQLQEKLSRGTIGDHEYQELTGLVERGEQLMLRKAQAIKLLIGRGHTVDLDALKPIDG